jgi:hypothetical protein
VNPSDVINASFEMSGGFFLILNVLKLRVDKIVRGISWITVLFFTVWGFWNIYYYAELSQWASWFATMFICFVNCVYTFQLIYYTRYPGGQR